MTKHVHQVRERQVREGSDFLYSFTLGLSAALHSAVRHGIGTHLSAISHCLHGLWSGRTGNQSLFYVSGTLRNKHGSIGSRNTTV